MGRNNKVSQVPLTLNHYPHSPLGLAAYPPLRPGYSPAHQSTLSAHPAQDADALRL